MWDLSSWPVVPWLAEGALNLVDGVGDWLSGVLVGQPVEHPGAVVAGRADPCHRSLTRCFDTAAAALSTAAAIVLTGQLAALEGQHDPHRDASPARGSTSPPAGGLVGSPRTAPPSTSPQGPPVSRRTSRTNGPPEEHVGSDQTATAACRPRGGARSDRHAGASPGSHSQSHHYRDWSPGDHPGILRQRNDQRLVATHEHLRAGTPGLAGRCSGRDRGSRSPQPTRFQPAAVAGRSLVAERCTIEWTSSSSSQRQRGLGRSQQSLRGGLDKPRRWASFASEGLTHRQM
jgi:hypothetical protein